MLQAALGLMSTAARRWRRSSIFSFTINLSTLCKNAQISLTSDTSSREPLSARAVSLLPFEGRLRLSRVGNACVLTCAFSNTTQTPCTGWTAAVASAH